MIKGNRDFRPAIVSHSEMTGVATAATTALMKQGPTRRTLFSLT